MKIVVEMTAVAAACALTCLAFCSCKSDIEPTGSTEEELGLLCPGNALSPADEDTVYEDSVLLSWTYTAADDCEAPSYYGLHVGIGEQMTAYEVLWPDHDTCTVTDLLMDTVYCWYLVGRTTEAGFDTCVSDTWCFHTESALAGLAYDPSPEDGALGVNPETNLEWSVHNPLGATYRFDVHFGTDANPPLAATDIAVATHEPGLLAANTTYYWQIAVFTDSDTTWGPVWEFTTADVVPIYGLFEVDGYFLSVSYHYDELRARFDSVYAPDEAIKPITEYTVDFIVDVDSTVSLTLIPATSTYSIFETSFPFLEPGGTYTYSVTRSPNTFELTLPACVPIITSPEPLASVSNDGFNVEWTGTECGGHVWLTMIKFSNVGGPDSAGVWVYTENDGSYTLTADDLADLETSFMNKYDIVIIKQEELPIVALGWLEESVIRVRLYNKAESVYLVEPGD